MDGSRTPKKGQEYKRTLIYTDKEGQNQTLVSFVRFERVISQNGLLEFKVLGYLDEKDPYYENRWKNTWIKVAPWNFPVGLGHELRQMSVRHGSIELITYTLEDS